MAKLRSLGTRFKKNKANKADKPAPELKDFPVYVITPDGKEIMKILSESEVISVRTGDRFSVGTSPGTPESIRMVASIFKRTTEQEFLEKLQQVKSPILEILEV